ncbi:hypothetical protein CNR22_23815 [Sphingobacteriaceae bacterium]|nr:hypothetical protein CNR22_23815 [Sphingobacteriaceae bacterium]
MKQTNKFLMLFSVLLSVMSLKMSAQCTNSSSFGSPTAPAPGTSITAVSCQYAGEYCTTSSVVAGNTYWVNSTVATDYFTIRIGASNGTLVASGPAPLVFTPTVSGTYYIHCNTSSACGTQSTCRNVLMGCYGPACTQSSAFGSMTAPNPTLTVYIGCQYAGEYGTLNSVTAGNVYVSASSVSTDYYTIRSGTSTGPVVAAGPSPLTWTAQVAGTHYIHVSSSSLCATQSSCRDNSVTCIGGAVPPAPANDLCAAAITMAVPSSTAGTTVNSTLESPAPGTCGTSLSQPGVWYKLVGNGNQIGVDLCAASSWDSKIFVYTGSCGAWTCVTGNDDNGPMCASGAASATFCSIPSTNYYVLVTGYSAASAFTIAVTQTVNSGANPTITATALTPSICLGSAGTLSVSGATNYAWSTGVGGASISITPAASGVYTVYGYGAAGCNYDVKTVTVTSIPTPTISLTANNGSICPGGSFTTTASGAASYTFAGSPSGTVIATTATLSPIVNTTYTVRGTGSNGCLSLLANSPSATVTTLASPSLTVVATPSAVCPGITSSLTVSGANTYTWASLSSNATVVPVSSSVTTVYTVSGTGTTVCNGVKTITLSVYPTPTITAASGTLCSGSVFTTVPSGALTYSYSTGASTVALTSNTTINVTGTSSNGCVSSAPAVVNVSIVALPVVSVNSGTVCAGSNFLLIPSGGTSYIYPNYSNPVLASTSGTYAVIGTNSAGCLSLPAIATLTVFSTPVLTVASTPSNLEVCITGSLSLTASGAVSYNWNNTATGASYVTTPTVNGSYFVIGTDANGCVSAATVPYTVNPLPTVSLNGSPLSLCAGGGSSTLTAGGALTYSWSASSTTSAVTVVTPTATTVYTVIGSNVYGCSRTKTLSIGVNTITINEMPDSSLCLGNSISVYAPGGSSYTWTPVPSIFSAVTVTPAVTTTYSYHTIDAKSCHHQGSITVSVNPVPVVTAVAASTLICTGETTTMTAAGAGNYLWTSPTTTGTAGTILVVNPNFSMIYMVTGTDVNGCSDTAMVSLTVSKCTGLNQLASRMNGLQIYPNPHNGAFTVDLANGSEKTIQIIDISGRILSTEISSENLVNVRMTEFANGVYYVKVQSNKEVSVVKVIKQ